MEFYSLEKPLLHEFPDQKTKKHPFKPSIFMAACMVAIIAIGTYLFNYQLVTQGEQTVVKATSQATASGLFKKMRIDLQQTPYLNWRWRVDNPLQALDEQTKPGDDYGARVYVVVDGGLFFWKTKAINYVWASSSPKGKSWPNAFAGKSAMMLALRSSTDTPATWYQEKRNVAADLKEFFGTEIRYIDAVAIMTDTDNSGQETIAYYGDIFFTSD